jgi:ribosomal protein L31
MNSVLACVKKISGVAVLLVLMFSGIALFGTHTFAQSIGSTDPLDVDVSPQYPTPYQNIVVTPSSTLFDISAATVSVTVNGTPFYSGSGQQSVSVPVGGPGTSTKIVVTAVSAGQSYTQSITIRPASVALVTEGVSSTHPFYEGGDLVGSNGRVRLIAIPDLRTSSGAQIDPSTLEYTWKLGDQVLQEDSGIGKNVLDATAPEKYRDADITVTVANSDNPLIAQSETSVSPVDPVTLVYRDDPLLGPDFDVALQNSTTMSDTEETYLGVPYYFSDPPTVTWTVNGTQSSSDDDITVRSSGNGQGTAVLNYTASDPSATQTANSTLSVVFGNQQSSGLFGL